MCIGTVQRESACGVAFSRLRYGVRVSKAMQGVRTSASYSAPIERDLMMYVCDVIWDTRLFCRVRVRGHTAGSVTV